MHAPARIHALPEQLANQIAAGEVVERPASVVKELLENAVDAGASRIELEVEEGGVRLIRISDDGHGICREDLSLALAPHATSKIGRSEDLAAILSLGFRGEALASIASVSRLRLSSRAADAEQGWAISLGAEAEPAAQPPGTRIEVRELFYNTPARRKFLRAERTEFAHIEEAVRRQALARFDIAFKLSHNGRSIFSLPAENSGERRVAALMGRPFLRDALSLDEQAAGMRLRGWFCPPDAARAQGDRQYFFLNGRPIRDRLIGHALRQAYGELLEAGRHAAYVLYLDLDPARVDVNVHPTKHEVRFRDSRMVHDFIHRALARELEREPQIELAVEAVTVEAEAGPATTTVTAPRPSQRVGTTLFPPRREQSPARIAEQLLGYEVLSRVPEAGELGEPVATLGRDYLLSRSGERWFICDRREGARRLALRQLERLQRQEGPRRRPLLLPQAMFLGETAAEVVAELADWALELEPLGDGQWVLRSIPALLEETAGAALAERLPAWLQAGAEVQALPALLAGCAEPPREASLKALAAELRELEALAGEEAPWRELDAATLASLMAMKADD